MQLNPIVINVSLILSLLMVFVVILVMVIMIMIMMIFQKHVITLISRVSKWLWLHVK